MVSASSTAIQTPKQPRLFVPFPNSAELESDVNMSDAPSMELTLSIPPPMFHSRLSSTASSSSYTSFDSPRSSPLYPTFELYPHEESQNQMSVDPGNYFDAATDSNSKSVGLIQPKGTSFTHHGNGRYRLKPSKIRSILHGTPRSTLPLSSRRQTRLLNVPVFMLYTAPLSSSTTLFNDLSGNNPPTHLPTVALFDQ
ncbi:hypothetical protein NLI96_g3367 [Meripilus lineatus]|uniref:Uncharacterized protein n=1 Tax=Meripilus lineatus TaxID=2056292 RepID=A0AAD5V8Z4_9APHY|nr:hypothetical protein NLI96_g3367 [Physisporinus lineatus]